MENASHCKHEGCKCATAAGSEYCSLYCETAGPGGAGGRDCDCGHPACKSKA